MQVEKKVPISTKGLLVHFNPSGNGRDLYVQHGEDKPIVYGNHPEKIPYKVDFKMSYPIKNKKNKMQPNFSKPATVTKYSLDGQGRDNYIGGDNGGFEKPELYNPHNFFKRLRSNDCNFPRKKTFNNANVDLRVRRLKLNGDIEVPKVDFGNILNRLNKPADKTQTREGRRDRRLRTKSQGYINNSYSNSIQRRGNYDRVDQLNTSTQNVNKAYDMPSTNINKTYDIGNTNVNQTYDIAKTNFYKTCAQNAFSNVNKTLMNHTFHNKPINNMDLIQNNAIQDKPIEVKPRSSMLNRKKLKEQTKGDYFMHASNSVPIKRCVISRMFNDKVYL